VLEFSIDTGLGEDVGAKSGTLGRWCSDWLERELMAPGAGEFTVTNAKVLQAALAKEKFGIDDLSNPERMKRLSEAMKGLPALVQGTLRSRAGEVATLQCRLLQTESDDLAGSAGGVARLNASEWAMLGKSVSLSPGSHVPPPPSLDDGPRKDPQAVLIDTMDSKAEGPHPMTNPNFEFPVRIYVGGKERPGYPRGNDWIVPLRKGEIFEIYVENRTGQPACMRLLVDGLNTLPDLEKTTKGVMTYVWGFPVNLADARHFVLDPAEIHTPRKVWRVSGFITQTGTEGKLRQFVVSTAEEALASQRNFTEQIGLITAAFYDPTPRPRGVKAGEEKTENLAENAKYVPGNLRAVVNIHYVDTNDPS
jgi:hypothetical protein